MKTRSKSMIHIFTFLTLLTMLIGILPASPVQAESPASPLYASGNYVWAKGMGSGSNYDAGNGIAVDSSGNVYTTGYFYGTVDFDPGPGTANLTSSAGGYADIFVSKSDSSGDYVWAKSMGGISDDRGQGIAVDSSGNVYTTGTFQITADFDPGVGTAFLTSAGNTDIFVSKLDSSGNFVWAKRMGGTEQDIGYGIALDLGGSVYTTGHFSISGDFDPGPGTIILTSAGNIDIFVSKLNSNGFYRWARSMGGTSNDYGGYGIAIDIFSNVYTTGYFEGTADFDPGAGTFNLISAGSSDIYVSKLNTNGIFRWAKRMGGTSSGEGGFGIAVDPYGNVYTTGGFYGTADFDPGAGITNLTSAGIADIFVSKLNTLGVYVWAKRMGGLDDDVGYRIAVDSSGNVYTTGSFEGTADFDPGAGTADLTSAGFGDIFVSTLDNSGNFVWAESMGGTSNDYGYDIAVDASSNVYTTGSFEGTADFDPGAGTADLTSAGFGDIFVSKLGNTGPSTFSSVGADDGWILELTETSGVGGTMNSTATTFNLGDDAANKQYRSILHFDTSSLPDTAVITGVTLKIRRQGLIGTDPFTTHEIIKVDIRNSGFSGNTALQLTDFQGAGSKHWIGSITNTPVSNWYSAILNSLAYPYVNLTGVTQFRLHFKIDDDNDLSADTMRFFSGDSVAATRPQLIVEYTVP